MSELSRFIEHQDATSRAAARQVAEEETRRQQCLVANRAVVAEFVDSMKQMGANPTTVAVQEVRTVQRRVKTGLFSSEQRAVVESRPVGQFRAWTTNWEFRYHMWEHRPVPACGVDLLGVCPDGLVFRLFGDSYLRDHAQLGPSISTDERDVFRTGVDSLLRMISTEELAAALAMMVRNARDRGASDRWDLDELGRV